MLSEKINDDLKSAMKNKDTIRLSCLRMIIADAKNLSIAKGGELTDDDMIGILQRQVKQHKDSIEGFKKGNRQDLIEKETKEMEIIQSYLPDQLSVEEIKKIVDETIAETGACDKSAMGKVMSAVMPKLKGRADGKLVQKCVMERLSGKE